LPTGADRRSLEIKEGKKGRGGKKRRERKRKEKCLVSVTVWDGKLSGSVFFKSK